jgi:hypothetical protein
MDLSRYGAVLGTRDLKRDLTIVGYIIVAIAVLLYIIRGQAGFLITAMGFLAFMLLVTNADGLRSRVPVFADRRPRVRRGAYGGLLVGTLLLASGHVNLLIIAVGLLAFTLLITNADGLRSSVPVFEDPRPLVRWGAYAGLLVGTFVLAGQVGPHDATLQGGGGASSSAYSVTVSGPAGMAVSCDYGDNQTRQVTTPATIDLGDGGSAYYVMVVCQKEDINENILTVTLYHNGTAVSSDYSAGDPVTVSVNK